MNVGFVLDTVAKLLHESQPEASTVSVMWKNEFFTNEKISGCYYGAAVHCISKAQNAFESDAPPI
jgi:hypothetical protein